MVEVPVIFGLVSWLLLTFLQWLSGLPVFPAFLLTMALCPFLTSRDYIHLSRTWNLRGIHSKRRPIPPERFYWTGQKSRLRRMILVSGFLSFLAWCDAIALPASLELNAASIFGWLNAGVGIITLTRALSAATLFFSASQWFDSMSPKVIGLLRQTMYRLSDNYEYLGSRRCDPEKEEVY